MRVVRLAVSIVLTVSAVNVASARGSATPTLRDQQQAACYDDVQKFCGSAMPDVNKVTACMKPLKSKVSAKCRAMWDVK